MYKWTQRKKVRENNGNSTTAEWNREEQKTERNNKNKKREKRNASQQANDGREKDSCKTAFTVANTRTFNAKIIKQKEKKTCQQPLWLSSVFPVN